MHPVEDNPQPAHAFTCQGLRGRVRVPGDKSISHRALMLSSQALGHTEIHGLLEGEDVLRTAEALKACGVPITRDAQGVWHVDGVGIGGLHEPATMLDMGNAGTACRLLMGLLAPYPFATHFTGDASLSKRPMQRVITPLEQMGATFMAREGGRLPLAMQGTAMPMPITYELPVASAQVKSAVMLAGLNTPGTTTVIEHEATRDHTERMLRFIGVKVEVAPLSSSPHRGEAGRGADTSAALGGSPSPILSPMGRGMPYLNASAYSGSVRITVHGQPQQKAAARSIHVPADPSSAAFPLVAALLVPNSEVTITGVCLNPLRTGLFTVLQRMGADLTISNEREIGGEPVGDITARTSQLNAVDVEPEIAPSMIDEYPILAVAAATANGTSIMRGLGELRVKESDRLAAIIAGLNACGVNAEAQGDDLIVHGLGHAPMGASTVTTHYDHRIAMSFLILGLISEQPIIVDDARAIATSFPSFMGLMEGLGAKFTSPSRGEVAPLGAGGGSLAASEKNTPTRPTADLPPEGGGKAPPLLIAVDGPAASGKGTLARRLADHFGLGYLDTGSLYRATAMRVLYAEKDPSDVAAAIAAARTITPQDLANPKIRSERIGQAASIVSAIPEVREALLDYQRNFAADPKGAALDGRDIGTVICPQATVKIFITASIEARAKRRHKQLSEYGVKVDYQSVVDDLAERDARDFARAVAPLKAADDAITIDTSAMTANEVFEKVLGVIGC